MRLLTRLYDNVCIHFISAAMYYLISWPEDDAMSVVADHMIVSPLAKEIIPVVCKVKGFERNLSKVVAAEIKAEMNSKLDN